MAQRPTNSSEDHCKNAHIHGYSNFRNDFDFFKKRKYRLSTVLFRGQVKLLIINNAFCIVQKATAQSKAGVFRGYGVAEAPPGFQAGWSDCMFYTSLFLFIL
jgi:hypothetical protein